MNQHLSRLINHKNLKRIFSESDKKCAIQLWLVKIENSKPEDIRLIYGRILPHSNSTNKWASSKNPSSKTLKDCKATIINTTILCENNIIQAFISLLSDGKNLEDISSTLHLEMDVKQKRLFGSFTLANEHYFRPVSYLPMRNDHNSPGLKSPHSSAGAFSGSIVSKNKLNMFSTNNSIQKDLIFYVIEKTNKDTGLDFLGNDIERLGDLELLVFPTLHDNGSNLLSVTWKAKEQTLTTSLLTYLLPNEATYFIKATFLNNKKTIYDALGIAKPHNDIVEYSFTIPIDMYDLTDSTQIEIHVQTDDSSPAELFAKYGVSYFRNLRLNFTHSQTSISKRVQLDWLTKTTNPDIHPSRIINALTIHRDNAFQHNNEHLGLDPWEAINKQNINLLSNTKVNKSEARFFERYSEGDGNGRIEFVEWIKTTLQENPNKQVFIFDPYFEDVGATLLIANASSHTNYTVFTTLESDEKKQRLNNLLSCCEQLARESAAIKIKIYGFPKHFFHDRYILISDSIGYDIKGFHLSNSLQAATDKHPLLITSIPKDTLPIVIEYAQKLVQKTITKSPPDKNDPLLIWDTQHIQKADTIHRRYEPLTFLNNPASGEILSAWTGESSINGLQSEELRNKLRELGILNEESFVPKILSKPDGAIELLSQCSAPDFNSYWEIMGHLLANTPIGEHYILKDNEAGESIVDRLVSFLKAKQSTPLTSTSEAQEALNLCSKLNISTAHLLKYDQIHYLCRGGKFKPLSWGDYYAIKILWDSFPETIIGLLSDFENQHKKTANQNIEITIDHYIHAQIIREIGVTAEIGSPSNLFNLLHSRDNPFLKWICFHALDKCIIEDITNASLICRLRSEDQMQFIGWMINNYSPPTPHPSAIFEHMTEIYLSKITRKLNRTETTEIIDNLRGRITELSWCEPWLTQKILNPLIIKNLIRIDDLAAIWLEEIKNFFQKMLIGQTIVFSSEKEAVTTNIFCYLFSRTSLKVQLPMLDFFEKTLERLSKTIHRPLIEASNWDDLDSALKISLWIYGLSRWTYRFLPRPNQIESHLVDLVGASSQLSFFRRKSEWEEYNFPASNYSILLKDQYEE
ncbi:hypothetical protein SAMN03159382_02357 [Pseudomonas sp. NFACC23-1]|uniref:VPA1262 family protein n=1 Tax=unclassified Pseudomonas TaxID=196821 RepID=UPI000890D30E|nr:MULTISPECIES: VPA1262 family protein [unclassified Pseudomonas]SDB27912.1 hypothetical protein SAMN03159386_02017 [Pseudomonas sp. NFACC17-2]SEJ40803.1 hypothetical protein SAMN03159382_02357 [Pseudomonas sp. NFACC23-1]SFW66109.1 hypothetical protein SAMN05660640_02565 [Pseudomonas sp. NFACC16-2]